MVSSIWTETWLNHFGPLIPHQFMIAYRGEMPCGICLLTTGVGQRSGPMTIQTYHLGTSGEPECDSACVEFNSLLSRPEDQNDFQLAIWEWVSARADWDEFRLDGFVQDEVQDWLSNNPGWKIDSKPSWYFDLEQARQSNQETIAMLGPQTRSAIRRNMRRSGTTHCEWAETVRQAEEIFAELITLHQVRWNADGLPGCYSSQVFREFHFELLNRLVPLELMGLFRVRNEQGTIGCDQVMIDNHRACLYQGGRIIPNDHRISTGVIVDYLLIEECRRRGLSAVDFMAGDTTHKQRLSTNCSRLIWAVYRRPNFKNGLISGLKYAKQAFERSFRGSAQKIPATIPCADSSDDLVS